MESEINETFDKTEHIASVYLNKLYRNMESAARSPAQANLASYIQTTHFLICIPRPATVTFHPEADGPPTKFHGGDDILSSIALPADAGYIDPSQASV